jgi:hypothetical protein
VLLWCFFVFVRVCLRFSFGVLRDVHVVLGFLRMF